MNDAALDERVKAAVREFWLTRTRQLKTQRDAGKPDQGARGEATGGSQFDGFIDLFRDVILSAGIHESCVFTKKAVELPGFYRPTKEWDLLVVQDGKLVAALESKSQVGSFGNNFNNRVEEAIGSAVDLWTAFREGRLNQGQEPWLGWMLLLEDCEKSRRPVSVSEPHFKVFPEFHGASYAGRYEIFCRRLMLERRYRAASLILSDRDGGRKGEYTCPVPEISIKGFVRSLRAHIAGWMS